LKKPRWRDTMGDAGVSDTVVTHTYQIPWQHNCCAFWRNLTKQAGAPVLTACRFVRRILIHSRALRPPIQTPFRMENTASCDDVPSYAGFGWIVKHSRQTDL